MLPKFLTVHHPSERLHDSHILSESIVSDTRIRKVPMSERNVLILDRAARCTFRCVEVVLACMRVTLKQTANSINAKMPSKPCTQNEGVFLTVD